MPSIQQQYITQNLFATPPSVFEAVAMDIIGHGSKAVSANYTHIEDEAKRKAVHELPDINEL